MDKLHPGSKWLFRIGAYTGFFLFAIVLSFISVNFLGFLFPVKSFLSLIIIVFCFFVFFVIVFGEIYCRLAYKNWKYKFEKDVLKLEHGIIWKKYSNIPYERVQNVDVSRGIFARMLGFSAIDVQTAGGTVARSLSEGHIPAVALEDAEKIRDFLIKKISKKSGGM